MDFDAYQKHAARTGGSDLLPENREKGLSCAGLGLTGEAGEVADITSFVSPTSGGASAVSMAGMLSNSESCAMGLDEITSRA